MSIIASAGSFLAQQQFLAGMIGATLTGGALFALRAVPAKLMALAREHLAVTVTLDSDDLVYRHLNVWLARHQYAKRARRLMMQEAFDYDQGRWGWEFTVGAGWHLIFYNRRPVLVHRHIQEASALDRAVGGGKRERLTLLSLGRKQAPIREIMERAKSAYEGGGMVRVNFWGYGGYVCADSRTKRDPDSVFVPEVQKQRLFADLKRFCGARAEYRKRGVPYRRGYLLEGPPGTGKTTLIQVCAGVVGRDLYLINLNNVQGDNDLMAAFNAVGSDGIVVIEDIDTATITHDRSLARASPPSIPLGGPVAPQDAQQPKGVTLSGLLNAIDGVAAREGRILFITSNHADKLDPALVRPGRVDVREMVALLDEDDAWRMFKTFKPEVGRAEFEEAVSPLLPISGAALQGMLLGEAA